jgi:hypothetical protein
MRQTRSRTPCSTRLRTLRSRRTSSSWTSTPARRPSRPRSTPSSGRPRRPRHGAHVIAERFHHLFVEEDDFGIIVVDGRFKEDDARLRCFFGDLAEAGTQYVKLGRIVEGLFLGPSHH